MFIKILPEDFRNAPRGVYGTKECPLYQALKRLYPNETFSVDFHSIFVGELEREYNVRNWTEYPFNMSATDYVIDPLYPGNKIEPPIAKINQLWLDVKRGKQVPEIEVEIIGFEPENL